MCQNRQKLTLAIVAVIALLGANQLSAQTNAELFTNRIIVKYKERAPLNRNGAVSQSALRQMSYNAREQLQHVRQMHDGAHVLRLRGFHSRADAQEIADRIETDPNVEYAEPDLMLQTVLEPNDSYYSQYQWHYHEITAGLNLPQAWDIADGTGVVVGVIDTGFLPHQDLVANLLPGYDMISDSFVSRDGDGRDADAIDAGDWTMQGECGNGLPAQDLPSSWHGTHVAGTIAADTNNGTGVAGVAFGAKVLPVRALGRCGGYLSDIADAIIWAAGGTVTGIPNNANPAQVLNLSFGGPATCGLTLQHAINTAHGLGTTIVVAAGNSNSDAGGFTPANCDNVITVAATDRDGNRAYYSNFGDVVDIAAPGGDTTINGGYNGVLSTFNTGQTVAEVDTYGFYQGTSMAAPHVSGTAALLYSHRPGITPSEIESTIRDTARDFSGSCVQCGTGIVDAYNALTDDGAGGGAVTDLENGVEVSGLSGNAGDELRFKLSVPEGASNLLFTLTGGTGDADLYIRFENQPTPSIFDCGSYQLANNETCLISTVQAGTYHVLVHGYGNFSGTSLLASYDEGGGNTESFAIHNLSGFWFSWQYYFVEIPEDTESLVINTYGGTGDADLYLRFGDLPGTGSYDCSSIGSSTAETCTINNPTPGTWYIGIRAALFYSGVSLSGQYTY